MPDKKSQHEAGALGYDSGMGPGNRLTVIFETSPAVLDDDQRGAQRNHLIDELKIFRMKLNASVRDVLSQQIQI